MNDSPCIGIAGSTGFIGRNLAKRFVAAGFRVSPIKPGKPWPEGCQLVINCIGRKDVANLENDIDAAITANVNVAGYLSALAKAAKMPFIHISSDHAYCNPQTVYALTKRLGDMAVMRANSDAQIVVTGHVYAPDCLWVKWLDGELKAGRKIEAYTNRVCNPTWIGSLFDYCHSLVSSPKCRGWKSGVTVVVGSSTVNRGELFWHYAMTFGYDEKLIWDKIEENSLFGNSSMESDIPACSLPKGLVMMRREMKLQRELVQQ